MRRLEPPMMGLRRLLRVEERDGSSGGVSPGGASLSAEPRGRLPRLFFSLV